MTAAELLARRRTLRSLGDLDDTDDVLVEHLAIGALCHLVTTDRNFALCGAQMVDKRGPLNAFDGLRHGAHVMKARSGRLCVACADRWSQ